MTSTRLLWVLLFLPLLALPKLFYDLASVYYGPKGTKVAATLELPTGGRFLVTQTGLGPEGYMVTFYACTVEGKWYEAPIANESKRWSDMELRFNAEEYSIEVLRGQHLGAEFMMDKGSLRRLGDFGAGRGPVAVVHAALFEDDYQGRLERLWREAQD